MSNTKRFYTTLRNQATSATSDQDIVDYINHLNKKSKTSEITLEEFKRIINEEKETNEDNNN